MFIGHTHVYYIAYAEGTPHNIIAWNIKLTALTVSDDLTHIHTCAASPVQVTPLQLRAGKNYNFDNTLNASS